MIVVDEKTSRNIEVFTERSKDEDYTGVEVCGTDGDWHAEIGCWFDEKGRLLDYDGVCELQMDVIRALRKAGWIVPRDFEDDLK